MGLTQLVIVSLASPIADIFPQAPTMSPPPLSWVSSCPFLGANSSVSWGERGRPVEPIDSPSAGSPHSDGIRRGRMVTVEQEKVGSLATALAHANRLLATAPAKAEAQVREILKVVPADPQIIRLLSVSLRLQERAEAALE